MKLIRIKYLTKEFIYSLLMRFRLLPISVAKKHLKKIKRDIKVLKSLLAEGNKND